MLVTAKLNHLRIAPRKVRLIADSIRGKSAKQALGILTFALKKSAFPVEKLLKSAIANAKNNFHLDEADLVISKISVDEGPKLKRWRPRARGSAGRIEKKTSHVTLVLESKGAGIPVAEAAVKGEAKTKRTVEKTNKERNIVKPEMETIKPKTEKTVKKMFKRQVF